MSGALRVLVTRPQAEAEAVATRLTEMGLAPVIAPVMAILFLDLVWPPPAPDAVVITSAQALGFMGVADRKPLPVPLFAVGTASASAARARGWRDVRTAAGDGQALRDLLRLTLPRPASLLYLAGRVHRPALAEGLQADRYAVRTVESYDAAPVAWSPPMLAELTRNPPEVVLHYSRRSAELALAAAQHGEPAVWFRAAKHICLSADVAVPLLDASIPHVTVAAQTGTGGVLDELARLIRR